MENHFPGRDGNNEFHFSAAQCLFVLGHGVLQVGIDVGIGSQVHIVPVEEKICVQEAQTLGITLIGMCDTNCDPEELSYIIPGNDDAIRAVRLIVSKMADAVIEANQGAEVQQQETAEGSDTMAEAVAEAIANAE